MTAGAHASINRTARLAGAYAFLEIIVEVQAKTLTLLNSDILAFEVHNILSEEKRAKVKDYLRLYNK